VIILRAESP